MKRVALLTILMISSIGIMYSQNYSPLKKGNKWTFRMSSGTYTRMILKKTVEFNGKEYFRLKTSYSGGITTVDFLRINENGDEVYLNSITDSETINMPKVIKVTDSWTSPEGSWRYEIYKTKAQFETPKTTYNDCLVIKAEQITQSDRTRWPVYYNYYVDGIGYVGSITEKGLTSYLTRYKLN